MNTPSLYKVWAVDGSGRSQHKLVRTLTGHAHRINSLGAPSPSITHPTHPTHPHTTPLPTHTLSPTPFCPHTFRLSLWPPRHHPSTLLPSPFSP